MHISASVKNARHSHNVSVTTGNTAKSLSVPCREGGCGSGINGGEFLMLALATCYCNDLYREAARLGISVDSVEVDASADFEGIGLAANNIRYRARVVSSASDAQGCPVTSRDGRSGGDSQHIARRCVGRACALGW